MARENIDLVRRLYAAIARKDEEAVFQCYHPDVEWHDDAWLDVGVHRGFEGIRAAHRDFFGQFESVTFEPHDFVQIGNRVVVTVRVVGRGRGSGIEVRPEVPALFTIRDGKISRTHLFSDREQALDAAGVSE